MNSILARRLELWFIAAICAGMGGFIAWIAVKREFLIMWWFAGPFLACVPLVVWKALKPDRYFVREGQKNEEFKRKHPILTTVCIVVCIIGFASTLWRFVGGMISE